MNKNKQTNTCNITWIVLLFYSSLLMANTNKNKVKICLKQINFYNIKEKKSISNFCNKSIVSFLTKKEKNILTLINKEKLMINSIKRLGPILNHRLISLDFEQLKIINKSENSKILSKKTGEQNKNDHKSKFYKYTMFYGKQIKHKIQRSVHLWPHYKQNYDLIYILALMERDFTQSKRSKKYFKRSLRMAKRVKANNIKKIQISLAELYYNNKEYKKAIRLYKKILKEIKKSKNTNFWLTKHLYNLSWCYFKNKEYQKALSITIKVFNLNQKMIKNESKRFMVNINQVMASLPIFFAYSKHPNSALEFYNSLNYKYKFKFFTRFIETIYSKKQKINIYTLMNSFLTNTKRPIISLQILNFILHYSYLDKKINIFKHTTLIIQNKFYKKSIILKLKIDDNITQNIIQEIESYTGYLQILLFKNKRRNKKQKIKFSQDLLQLLQSSAIINPSKDYLYYYFIGNLYLKNKQAFSAFSYLKKSLERIQKIKTIKTLTKKTLKSSQRIQIKVFNSFFNAISQIKNKKINKRNNKNKLNFKIFKYVYLNYLKYINAKDQIAIDIYNNLFELYLKEKDFKLAEKILKKYTKNIQADKKLQNEMWHKIFNFHISTFHEAKILFYLNSFNSQDLSISKKDIDFLEYNYKVIIFNKSISLMKRKKYQKAFNKILVINSKLIKNRELDLKIIVTRIQLSILLNNLDNILINYNFLIKILSNNVKIKNDLIIFLNTINDNLLELQLFNPVYKLAKLLYLKIHTQKKIKRKIKIKEASRQRVTLLYLLSSSLIDFEKLKASISTVQKEIKNNRIRQSIENIISTLSINKKMILFKQAQNISLKLLIKKLIIDEINLNIKSLKIKDLKSTFNKFKKENIFLLKYFLVIKNYSLLQKLDKRIKKFKFKKFNIKKISNKNINLVINFNIKKFNKFNNSFLKIKHIENDQNLLIYLKSQRFLNKKLIKYLTLKTSDQDIKKSMLNINNNFKQNIKYINQQIDLLKIKELSNSLMQRIISKLPLQLDSNYDL